jgi:NifB/MoaA-like Fe-S oxidoreductase
MINMEAYEAEMDAERKQRAGFRAPDYTGDKCKNCVNGRHVCEKCAWDADRNEYCAEWSPLGL